MTPLLAQEESRTIADGLRQAAGAIVVVAAIAAAFGVVYWLIRRNADAKETARRKAEFDARRARREGGKGPDAPE